MKYLYALIDPRFPDAYRYIGFTGAPRKRLPLHFFEAKKYPRYYRSRWINSLLRQGIRPHMRILSVHADDARIGEYEKALIRRAKAVGHRLTNATEGGEGSTAVTAETVRKRLMNTKKWRQSNEAKLFYARFAQYTRERNRGSKRKNAASQYYGVVKCRDKFRARYCYDGGTRKWLGDFKTEREAAIAVHRYCAENNLTYYGPVPQ